MAGLPSKQTFDLEADEAQEIDPALLQYLRLKLLSGTDAFILEPIFRNTVWETLSLPFSLDNELQVLRSLEAHCQSNAERLRAGEAVVAQLAAAAAAAGDSAATARAGLMETLRRQELAALEGSMQAAQRAREGYEVGGTEGMEFYQERRLRELDLLRPLDESEIAIAGERIPYDDDY